MTARDVGIAILAAIGRFDALPEGLTQQGPQFFGKIRVAAHRLHS